MSYQFKKLDSGEAEIEVTISAADLKTESSWAAARLSKDFKIPGFRPGKAPYDIVKRELGEMKILEEAANKLINSKLNEIIKKENPEIATQPKIEIKKLASGNDLIFKATFALFPEITLPELTKIKVNKPNIKVEPNKLDETLNNLQQMRAKEILEKRPVQKGDKVQVDFEVKVDGKVIDGGKAEKYNIIIGENQMIPGFEDQLIGMKENEEKEFKLNFPKNYKPELAGEVGNFKIKLHAVYKRELPELNDEFAKTCGVKNLGELKSKINENLKKQAEFKAKEKQELDLIEKLTDAAKFGLIPDILIESEQNYMLQELKSQIQQSEGKFEDYLTHIKKSETEIKQGFKDNAEKRVKTQLVFRKIIIDNKLEPDKKQVDQELKKAELMYSSIPEMLEKIKSDNYRNYVESMILNRQVIEWLKNKVKIKE